MRLALAALLVSSPLGGADVQTARAESPVPGAGEDRAGGMQAPSLARLPRSFIENRGQLPGDTTYYLRAGATTVHLTGRGVRYELAGPREPAAPDRVAGTGDAPERLIRRVNFTPAARSRAAVEVGFIGANPVRPVGQAQAPTVYHFQAGPRDTWRSDVPTFGTVTYAGLWPGIDLVYESTRGGPKYTFEVAPGADPRMIRLAYAGPGDLRVNDAGQLVMSTAAGELRDDRPLVYQEIEGQRVVVPGAYAVEAREGGAWEVGFRLGAYDPTRRLVIDPVVLVYSGLLGGTGWDVVNALTLDPAGIAYAAGETENPVTHDVDAFVARISADGTQLLSMTVIGGSRSESVRGIALDGWGNIYIAGDTSSGDLPIVNGFDPICGSDGDCNYPGTDGFMMKLSPSGAILYSTYIGGSAQGGGGEAAFAIAVDPFQQAVVVGLTSASDFPTLGALYPVKKGPDDGFVTRIDPAESGAASLVWSTYLGGSGNDALFGVATDSLGAVYVTGYAGAGSIDYPLVNPVHGDRQGTDVVVTRLRFDGSGLDYSTYLGGQSNQYEQGLAIAVDQDRNAYVTGFTGSATFPTTPWSPQPHCQSVGQACVSGQAFVTRLSPFGQLVHSTYLGGSQGPTRGQAIAVDDDGRAYVTGSTADPSYPTTPNALDASCGTDGACDAISPDFKDDAFVAVLSPNFSHFVYSSFLGGHDADMGNGIAVGSPGVIHVAGEARSAGTFPATPGAWDTTLQGFNDGFVAKLVIGADLGVVVKDFPDPVVLSGGGLAHYTVQVKNAGPETATAVLLPITFTGPVARQVQSVQLSPPGIGACQIMVQQWVSCSFPSLKPGASASLKIDVKVLELRSGKKQLLTASATVDAAEPDPVPGNNQAQQATVIIK
jgi:hypothetical protein